MEKVPCRGAGEHLFLERKKTQRKAVRDIQGCSESVRREVMENMTKQEAWGSAEGK